MDSCQGLKRRLEEHSPEDDDREADPIDNTVANARKNCHRNGQPPKRKRRTVGRPQELEPNQSEDTGESQKYVSVQEPSLPSADIQSCTSALLLKLASCHLSDVDSWVDEVTEVVKGSDWVSQTEALADNCLLQIAQRCQRAEAVNTGASFVRIVAELSFAAKVNGQVQFPPLTPFNQ